MGQEVGNNLTKEANKKVAFLENSTSFGTTKQCKLYSKLTPEQKSIVAKYAMENGVVAAIRWFSKEFDSILKEGTIPG